MSLMAPFFIGMALAEERKVDPMAAGLLSVAAFMTVTPYSVGEAYAVGANWLGGANIISGMIIGLVVAEMFTFVIRRNWVITLPDSVPASVSRSFSALIPGFLILSVFGIISWRWPTMAATSTRSSWTPSPAAGVDGQRGGLGLRYL
jgi:PTS system cellobiose-specific IIC component